MIAPFCGAISPQWTDMSNYVVHFTREYEGQDAYHNMLGILGSKTISARNPFGIGRKLAPSALSQTVVCFSEVPLHQLSRLASQRSEYGIVFRKPFVIHRHGNPIMYAYREQDHLVSAFKKLMTAANGDPSNPIWEITPFVDVPGVFGASSYFFEWEREWRKVGDFEFPVDEVEFLIIPEKLHLTAEQFFEDAQRENLGPAYKCPFIDAHWPLEKIEPLLPKAGKQT